MEPHILDSIPDLKEYKTFTERYFSKRYLLNVDGVEGNDIMLMFHSNRITLICLAPSHLFFKKKGDFKVNFNVGNINRMNNTVRGKGKKGGQYLLPNSVICKLELDDETIISVPCGMKSTLIEVNERLVEEPNLLRDYPDSDGFIAIVLSSIAISESTKNELLTHEDYVKIKSSNGCTE